MSRLPTVTPRQMVRILLREGFVKHHQRGSHLYLKNEITDKITSAPMHSKGLKKGTLHAILKQVGLTEEKFRGLI